MRNPEIAKTFICEIEEDDVFIKPETPEAEARLSAPFALSEANAEAPESRR